MRNGSPLPELKAHGPRAYTPLAVWEPLPPVLLFDLDDTILDDTGARDECWRVACQEAAAAHPDLDADTSSQAFDNGRLSTWNRPVCRREGPA